MAAAARETRYRGRQAVNGSLAYDLDYAVRERELRHAGEAVRKQEKVHSAPRVLVREREYVSKLAVLGVAAIMGLALVVLMNYVELTLLSSETVKLQSQLAELETEGLTWSTRAEDELRGEVYDVTNTVEEMSLSPLSLSYRYTTTLPKDNSWIDAGLGPVELILKDGTEIPCIHGHDTDVGDPQAGTRELEGFIVFDQPLDLSQVDYVQYGDNKIPVNAG